MITVNKAKARKEFNNGKEVILLPCKARVPGMTVTISNSGNFGEFEQYVDNFIYYNCNNEVGTYNHFYIIEE